MDFFSFSFLALCLLLFPPSSLASPSQDMDSSSSLKDSLPAWTCRIEKKDSAWTVGDKRHMTCRGDYIEKFSQPPHVVFPKKKADTNKESLLHPAANPSTIPLRQENKDLNYSLVILDLKMSDHNQASFLVTSYKTGLFFSPFFLEHSNVKVTVQPLQWKVKSVLKPNEQAKEFGPIGPMLLAWPKQIQWIFLSVLFLLLLFFSFKTYKILLRKVWKKRLLEKRTSLSPYFQFNRDLRKNLRSYHYKKIKIKEKEEKEKWNKNYILQIKTDFYLFLEREFLVPVQSKKKHFVIKEMHRKMKTLKAFKEENTKDLNAKGLSDTMDSLSLIMKEFEKVLTNSSLPQDLDCEQLEDWIKDWAGKWEERKNRNQSSFKKSRRDV